MIRIGIVDDHPVFRFGLKRALEREADFDVTWELGSATNIDAQMRRTPVDVILMDLYMGSGKDGFAATRDVIERWPGVKVLVISASVDERNVLASARAGADGFLPKAMPVSDMVRSIRRLASGDAPGRRVGNTATERRARSRKKSTPRKPRTAVRIGGLSVRQRQVLDELRHGRTNREIAEHMGVSITTVNKHVHEVLKALKVRNRTEAAAAGRTLQE
ncbi:MAG TPA: response regulator transcription factor [Candidatus Dormibacteraeota bacterium]